MKVNNKKKKKKNSLVNELSSELSPRSEHHTLSIEKKKNDASVEAS